VSGSNITIHSPEELRSRHAHRSGVKMFSWEEDQAVGGKTL
jgi:hypothetical protein